ncbi:MAG: hypothetical protein KC910_13780 [Candidatus Eremiobacteraeota bacterium]|nr:hypothetical protein [Candidatus Eremiobacteraeota bacterium]
MDSLGARQRGVTLAEAIIAIFLIVAGFVVMAALFDTALRYQARIEADQTAILVAESRMEEVRGWNDQVHGSGGATQFSNWAAVQGTGPDPNYPGYNVTVTVDPGELYSPCSLFELQFPNNQRRWMRNSARTVTVQVDYNGRSFSLVSLIAQPTKEPGTVSVSPSSGQTLGTDATRAFTVTMTDSDGDPLDDIFFDWRTDPTSGPANGVITATRIGDAADLTNHILSSESPPQVVGYGHGTTKMQARAVYRGKEATDLSGALNLLSP